MPPISRSYQYFDPGQETSFSLKAARKHGVPASYKRLLHYALEGVENPLTKTPVRLRVCRLPCGLGTTLEEYQRFISRLNTQ